MADPKAENNVQHFLAKIAGVEEATPAPQTNVEHYLAKIAGEDVAVPEEPSTTEEYYLDKIAEKELVEAVPFTVDNAGTFEAPEGKAYSPVTVPSGSATLGALTKEQVNNNTVRVVGTVTKGKGFIQNGTESKNTTVQASEVTYGTRNITSNGTHDVTNYKSAQVAVPQTTVEALSVTENGTYTAPSGKAYSPVTVNVNADKGLKYFNVSLNSSSSIVTVTDEWLANNYDAIKTAMIYPNAVVPYDIASMLTQCGDFTTNKSFLYSKDGLGGSGGGQYTNSAIKTQTLGSNTGYVYLTPTGSLRFVGRSPFTTAVYATFTVVVCCE